MLTVAPGAINWLPSSRPSLWTAGAQPYRPRRVSLPAVCVRLVRVSLPEAL